MSTQPKPTEDHARENARAWLSSIVEMVEKLTGVDYEAELDHRGIEPFKDQHGAQCWRDPSDNSTWAGTAQNAYTDWLELDPDDAQVSNDTREEAEREIQESPLSVLVCDGWHSPGQPVEYGPEEFEILLSTGGPALRIYGTLNENSEPDRLELQYQDWFTPWTDYRPMTEDERSAIKTFASQFYFGD